MHRLARTRTQIPPSLSANSTSLSQPASPLQLLRRKTK
jgi:hypothetical protein